jgi:CheY-like chemotaxis protein
VTSPLGLRILCVDDDEGIRESLSDLLRGEGYEVDLAACAEEALERLRTKRFQLVISDYALPDKTGAVLLREAAAQKLLEGTEVLIITAYPEPRGTEGIRLFRKPLDVEYFLRKIYEILTPARNSALEKAREDLQEILKSDAAPVATRRVDLVLYISAASTASLKALRNMQRLLLEYEPAQIQFTVYDLSRENPKQANEDRIAFTPTLVKRSPDPRAWILGDLGDARIIADLLSLSGVERKR